MHPLLWIAPVGLLLAALWLFALPTVTCTRTGDGPGRCTLTRRGLLRPALPIATVEVPQGLDEEEVGRLVVVHPEGPPSRLATSRTRAASVHAEYVAFVAGRQASVSRLASVHYAVGGALLGLLAVGLAVAFLRMPQGPSEPAGDDPPTEQSRAGPRPKRSRRG